VLSKCVAGRERDWEFARDALAAGLVLTETLVARISDLPVDVQEQRRLRRMLRALSERVKR
jgi:hypothetical protein